MKGGDIIFVEVDEYTVVTTAGLHEPSWVPSDVPLTKELSEIGDVILASKIPHAISSAWTDHADGLTKQV